MHLAFGAQSFVCGAGTAVSHIKKATKDSQHAMGISIRAMENTTVESQQAIKRTSRLAKIGLDSVSYHANKRFTKGHGHG